MIQLPSFVQNAFLKETPIAEKGEVDWEAYKNEEYEFKYPKELDTTYIDTQNWPPIITVREFDPSFLCEDLEVVQTPVGLGEQRQIDDKYCLLTVEEGVAGTKYVNYAYVAVKANKYLTIEFALRFINCGVFGEEMTECENEQADFDINSVVDEMLDSFLLTE